MSFENKFTEEDKSKVVQFLNFIATKAKFEVNSEETIKYFHLLSFMQRELLPKINSHILEVKKVIEETKEE